MRIKWERAGADYKNLSRQRDAFGTRLQHLHTPVVHRHPSFQGTVQDLVENHLLKMHYSEQLFEKEFGIETDTTQVVKERVLRGMDLDFQEYPVIVDDQTNPIDGILPFSIFYVHGFAYRAVEKHYFETFGEIRVRIERLNCELEHEPEIVSQIINNIAICGDVLEEPNC